jgi:hypothetical protein
MMNEEDHSVDEQNVAAAAAAEGDTPSIPQSVPGAAPGKALSPEAIRALQEAEARRVAAEAAGQKLPTEIGGRRDGGEPTRFGDWEKKGIAVDF